MTHLNQKEWVAVFVSLFVVGFFFIFGGTLLNAYKQNSVASITLAQPKTTVEDVVIGGGDTVVSGSRVTVNYVASFEDGTVFDSSIARNEPFQFVVGSGQVIPGLDEAIVGMRVGGKRVITIPPELGYGLQDYGPIPGGSILVFDIELLKVEKPQE
jgi:FKBP-type peptidyl-prolyl cis-trans isomerase